MDRVYGSLSGSGSCRVVLLRGRPCPAGAGLPGRARPTLQRRQGPRSPRRVDAQT